ncbi:hypothetical protein [Gallibacterium anatis]|uniref:hypothetical protein n=1 Tax=Gallibacterium anatis TaxID=750 RepID=UPI0012D36ED9|nr:hypothetical protein [Gallibacterium anatis]
MNIDITPLHFYNSVNLLKNNDFSIAYNDRILTISFKVEKFELESQRIFREEQIGHLYEFLKELSFLNVPTDLNQFIEKYRPYRASFRRRQRG